MEIDIVSFGFKHGPPPLAESLFDVRFLPNPYYLPELRQTTGLFAPTAAYALENDVARQFFQHLLPLVDFLIQQYRESKRQKLQIAVGCTGGRHRSVAVAEALGEHLRPEQQVEVRHRDIHRE